MLYCLRWKEFRLDHFENHFFYIKTPRVFTRSIDLSLKVTERLERYSAKRKRRIRPSHPSQRDLINRDPPVVHIGSSMAPIHHKAGR